MSLRQKIAEVSGCPEDLIDSFLNEAEQCVLREGLISVAAVLRSVGELLDKEDQRAANDNVAFIPRLVDKIKL